MKSGNFEKIEIHSNRFPNRRFKQIHSSSEQHNINISAYFQTLLRFIAYVSPVRLVMRSRSRSVTEERTDSTTGRDWSCVRTNVIIVNILVQLGV